MSGKKRFPLIFLLISFTGCAEPKYPKAQQPSPGNTSQNQKVTDCRVRFQNSGYCLLWQWEKLPTATQAGSVVFKVVRANALDDSPVPVDLHLTPHLVLWMPAMGHGSSPTTIEQVDTGSYRANDVFFIMPGEWELKFQFKDESSVQDEAVVVLTF